VVPGQLKLFIAVNPTPDKPDAVVIDPTKITSSSSSWAIAAAIMVAAMPHLWQWINGHQTARNNLTENLLQKLSESYSKNAISTDAIRTVFEDFAEKPIEIAEDNSQRLRDLQGETADMRTQLQRIEKKVESMASMVARLSQNGQNRH
jgi:hypothetical protein